MIVARERPPRCRLALLVAMLASASLGAAAGQGTPVSPPGAKDAATPVTAPGSVIVKLKPSVRVAADRVFARDRSLDGDREMRGLDRVGRRHGLRGIRPVRSRDARLATLAERRRVEASRLRARGLRRDPMPSFASTYVFELDPATDVDVAAAEYAQHPAVEWAEPDHLRSARFVPNDPYFLSSGAWNQPFGDLWGLHSIDASTAWDTVRGDGVVVAIIDTGIDLAHPDMADNAWVNSGEIPGNGIDDDDNGFVDDAHGWNFVDGARTPSDPTDDFGHGTMVAGIVAATGNNQVGVIGVAWKSRVMALKSLDDSGSGRDSGLADATLYAAENGAAVINASWGGFGGSQLLAEAIKAVSTAGVVFVAAAGNSGADISGTLGYPEMYPANDPHAIAVAACDHLDQPAPFTNFGQRLDLTAPGGGDTVPQGQSPDRSVLSLLSPRATTLFTGAGTLVVGQRYLRQAGTSFAAPFVAGSAALLAAARPELDVEQIRQALRAGADDVGAPGLDDRTGAGRLNAARSLDVQPLAVRILAAERVEESGVEALVVRGSVYGPGFVSYRVEAASDVDDPVWVPVAGPVTAPVVDGELGRWIPGAEVVNGRVVVRVIATGAGRVFEDRFVARIVRARLTSPGDERTAHFAPGGGGLVEIRGSVSVPGLRQYTISYWTRCKTSDDVDAGTAGTYSQRTTAGIVLANGGTEPVSDGLLATFDPSVLPGPCEVHFELAVETTHTTYPPPNSGDLNVRRDVIVDRSVRQGWPRMTHGFRNSGPVLADLDGDGQTEVLALGWDRDGVRTRLFVFEPDGSDRPGWPQLVAAQEAEPPFFGEDAQSGPSAADLDRDGLMEIVVTKGDSVYVFHDDGRLAQGWPRRFPGATSRQSALVDLEGDGQREIVFAYGIGQDGSVRVGPAEAGIHALRLDGTELAGFPARLETPGFPGAAVAVGDVTGDGRLEIAVLVAQSLATVNGRVEKRRDLLLELIDASGRPAWPRRARLGRMELWIRSGSGLLLSNEQVFSPILADADGDGVLDVVANSHRSARRLYVVSGNGRSRRIRMPRPVTTGVSQRDVVVPSQSPVTAGDLDGDGIPELSVTSFFESRCDADCPYYQGVGNPVHLSHLHALSYDGRRWNDLHGRPRFIPVANPLLTGGTAIADLDGDAAPDLALVPGHETTALSPLNAFRSNGTWIAGFPKVCRLGSNSRFSTPALGDLDGDGRVELVVVDGPGLVIVWNTEGRVDAGALQWPMARHDAQATGALPVGN
jgi:subtilisin family serine protease